MRRILVGLTAAALLATMLALAGPSFAEPDNTNSVKNKLAELREATAKYQHDLSEDNKEKLAADGYVEPNGGCVQIPAGGMGYHYIHREDVNLPADDPNAFAVGVGGNHLKPEGLLYAPDPNPQGTGEIKLVGVEYMVRDQDGDKKDEDGNYTHNDPRPRLFDRIAFDGPMEPHRHEESWMPYHYDLHVWIWEDNPNGMFEQWNPNVSCTPPS